jgi:pimeloyl-ACP methyl ester carboxylesterase
MNIPVVFVHGMFGGRYQFERLMARFPNSHAIDFREELRNRRLDISKGSMTRYREYLRDFIANQFNEPVHLVGHSMGALVSQLMQEKHPYLVRSMTFVNGSFPGNIPVPRSRRMKLPAVVRMVKYARKVMKEEEITLTESDGLYMCGGIPMLLLSDSGRVFKEIIVGSARVAPQSERMISSYRCPVLVIAGNQDVLIPVAVSHELWKMHDVRGSATFVNIDGSHMMLFDHRTEKGVTTVIEQWLQYQPMLAAA